MENEKPKAKWHNVQDVKVQKVKLELTGRNNELVHRIRFIAEPNDITYKPRKATEIKSETSGFETTANKGELYTISEFIAENPMLKVLNDKAKDIRQKIIVSYAELEGDDGQKYHFLRDNGFKEIYYEEHHGKDTSETLDKQKERAKKFEVVEP